MTDNIDQAAQHLLETELLEGEELLWVGKPSNRSTITRQLPQAALTVGVFIAILALFMSMFGFRALAMPFASPIFGIMGLIIVLGILASGGNLLTRFLNAHNTTYAITNRRVLIVEGTSRRITSFGEDDLQRIERHDHGGGTGDIVFRYEPHVRNTGQAGWYQTRVFNEPIGFLGIENVREVERLLISTFLMGDAALPAKRKHNDLSDDGFEEFYADYEEAISRMLPGEEPEPPARPQRR